MVLAGCCAGQNVNLDSAGLAKYCTGMKQYGAADQPDMANLAAPYNALIYAQKFSCTIPVSCQLCRVTIGFVENRLTQIGVGQRVFTVSLNGLVSSPIDLFKLVGSQKGLQQSWTVPGFDGFLRLTFTSLVTGMNALASSLQAGDALPPAAAPSPVMMLPVPFIPICGIPLACPYDPATNRYNFSLTPQ